MNLKKWIKKSLLNTFVPEARRSLSRPSSADLKAEKHWNFNEGPFYSYNLLAWQTQFLVPGLLRESSAQEFQHDSHPWEKI